MNSTRFLIGGTEWERPPERLNSFSRSARADTTTRVASRKAVEGKVFWRFGLRGVQRHDGRTQHEPANNRTAREGDVAIENHTVIK